MRSALALLLVLAAAAPVAAQSAFVETCVASVAAEGVEGIDAGALCGCAAEGTIARGVRPADLDAAVGVLTGADPASASEAVRAAALVSSEALMSCAVGISEMARTGAAPPMAGAEGVAPGQAGAAAAVAAPPARLPDGMRTGNGNGTVRSTQAGTGAAIRIVGE